MLSNNTSNSPKITYSAHCESVLNELKLHNYVTTSNDKSY